MFVKRTSRKYVSNIYTPSMEVNPEKCLCEVDKRQCKMNKKYPENAPKYCYNHYHKTKCSKNFGGQTVQKREPESVVQQREPEPVVQNVSKSRTLADIKRC